MPEDPSLPDPHPPSPQPGAWAQHCILVHVQDQSLLLRKQPPAEPERPQSPERLQVLSEATQRFRQIWESKA